MIFFRLKITHTIICLRIHNTFIILNIHPVSFFLLLFYYLKIKIQIDCDALIHRQRGQIIRLVTAVNMTVRRRHHPHSISVPQLRSPFHRTSNPTILVRVVDVVVFDRQDHSTNLTKKKI